jgi:hypothetical protein
MNIYDVSNIEELYGEYIYEILINYIREYYPDYEIIKYDPDEFAVFQMCNKIFHNVYELNKFNDVFIDHELPNDILYHINDLTFDKFDMNDYIISNDYGDINIIINLSNTKKINAVWFIN